MSNLVHVKGRWAGHKFVMSDWQIFITCCIFGWVDDDRFRRYIEAYIEVPRKNGKSFFAAAIGLYMFLADAEAGAEIYSGASTEKQAWEVFRPAKFMTTKTPGLQSFFGVEVFTKSMFCARTASRFEPIIGKPNDGASPSCAIIDEYHEHKDDDSYGTMKTGMGSRDEPLLLVITTAGTNLAAPCYHLHGQIERLLDKVIENERLFGIIYSIDKKDDWQNIDVWKKANPNFGISLNTKFLQQQLATAIQDVSQQNIILTKNLDIWRSVNKAWMDMTRLRKCADPTLLPDKLKSKQCIFGVDLASKIDIAAKVFLFYDETDYYFFGSYYLPRETVENPHTPNKSAYETWEYEGWLTVTEGATIDFSIIEDDLLAEYKKYKAECVAYDPFQATEFSQKMSNEGCDMVEVGATVGNFSEAMKEFQRAVYAGKFHYNGDPIFEWMCSNVVAHYDKKDNIYPNKETNANKIDGVVAAIMCFNLAIRLKNKAKSKAAVTFI